MSKEIMPAVDDSLDNVVSDVILPEEDRKAVEESLAREKGD